MGPRPYRFDHSYYRLAQVPFNADFVSILLIGPPGRMGNPTFVITVLRDAKDISIEEHRDADIAFSRKDVAGYLAEDFKALTIDNRSAVSWTATLPSFGRIIKDLEVTTKNGNYIYSITYQSALEDFDLQYNAVSEMISSTRFP